MASLTGLPELMRAPGRHSAAPQSDPQSFVGKIGSKTLSGIAAVGNLLDLPGSTVRDLIGGEGIAGSFDQWMTPFSDANRTSGRDLLERGGLLNANRPGFDLGDVAGFGLEVLADPLAPLSFGASALTKAGKAAKAAGNLTRGTRAGIQAGERGLVGIGLPFMDPALTVGTGQTAQKIAGGLDRVGEAVRYGDIPGTSYSPGRHMAQLFDADVMGRTTTIGQKAAKDLSRTLREGQEGVLGDVLPMAESYKRSGMDVPAEAAKRRDMLEGVRGQSAATDPTGYTAKLQQKMESLRQQKADRGLPSDVLDDPANIGYAPRHLSDKVQSQGVRNQGPLGTKDSADAMRQDVWKGFFKGTSHVEEVVTDPKVGDIIEQGLAAGRAKKDIVGDVSQYIESTHGNDIFAWMPVRNSKGKVRLDANGDPLVTSRYRAIAQKLVDNPEIREGGLFRNDPLVDATAHLMRGEEQVRIADTIFDLMAKHSQAPSGIRLSAATPQRGITIGAAFKELGIKGNDGARQILQRQGVNLAGLTPKQLFQAYKQVREMELPKEIGDDLIATWPAFRTPPEVGTLGKGIDSLTNLFKAGVLTWPARYVRDLTSGQIRNVEAKMFDLHSAADAQWLIQGKPVSADTYRNLPPVQQTLQQMGVNAATATDDDVGRALRILYGQYGPGGRNIHTDVAGQAGRGGITGETLDDLLGRVPGMQPQSLGQVAANVAKTAVGRQGGTNLNPFNVRGVGNQADTTFGPVAAGEIVGRYTDDMNRMVPFLHLLKKGWDPGAAMEKIRAAQVDYSSRAFTPTERQLKRVFPFYSFASRQLPWVVRSLMEQPGGRLAQTIRATGNAAGGDPTTPEYVAQTTSIPLGEQEDGTKRYLTGLGLMHEDPLSFGGGGVRGALTEIASRTNPLLKGGLEWATGESFFQRGPMGGRDIDDMDPTMGRTLTNISDTFTGERTRDADPLLGSQALEFIAANSPLSRALTTARKLSDPRKGLGVKALSTLTGAGISDISPAAQESVLREKSQAFAKGKLGAKSFNRFYIPNELQEETRKTDPELAAEMDAVEAFWNDLAKKAKARKKERERSGR